MALARDWPQLPCVNIYIDQQNAGFLPKWRIMKIYRFCYGYPCNNSTKPCCCLLCTGQMLLLSYCLVLMSCICDYLWLNDCQCSTGFYYLSSIRKMHYDTCFSCVKVLFILQLIQHNMTWQVKISAARVIRSSTVLSADNQPLFLIAVIADSHIDPRPTWALTDGFLYLINEYVFNIQL